MLGQLTFKLESHTLHFHSFISFNVFKEGHRSAIKLISKGPLT